MTCGCSFPKAAPYRGKICNLHVGMGQRLGFVAVLREGADDVGPQLAIAAQHCDFHRASTFPMAYVSIPFSSCLKDAILE